MEISVVVVLAVGSVDRLYIGQPQPSYLNNDMEFLSGISKVHSKSHVLLRPVEILLKF